MTYTDALKESKRVGAAHAAGLPLLALTIRCFATAYPINAKLAYAGAVKLGLTAQQVRMMDSVALGDLMFV